MTKKSYQKGDVITVAAPYDVLSGAGVRKGHFFGIALYDALSGANVEIALTEVHTIAKTSAQAWTVGQPIYWDDSAKVATTVTTSPNMWIGLALVAAANPSSTGVVRLGIMGVQDPETTSG